MRTINVNNNNDDNDKFDFEKIKRLVMVDYKRITIMATIAAILIIAAFSISSSLRKSEDEAIALHNKYQSDLLATKANNRDAVPKTVIVPSDTAVDVDKINSDVSSAEKHISTWFDWKNGDEYDAARESVLGTFGEDSIMSSVFVENARTSSGNSYVDNFKVNMLVNSIKTYPISIDKNGDNKYMSMIAVSSSMSSASSTYVIMMIYTYDKNSNITDARVFLNNK